MGRTLGIAYERVFSERARMAPSWWQDTAMFLGYPIEYNYEDQSHEDEALGRLLKFVKRHRKEGTWVAVPTPYHLSPDKLRRAVILHELKQLHCYVMDASQLPLARPYLERRTDQDLEQGKKIMCLSLEDHPIFEEIEWFQRLLNGAKEKSRQSPGRKPFRDEATINRILELATEGTTLAEVARSLNGEGRKTDSGKPFTPQNVGYYLYTRRGDSQAGRRKPCARPVPPQGAVLKTS